MAMFIPAGGPRAETGQAFRKDGNLLEGVLTGKQLPLMLLLFPGIQIVSMCSSVGTMVRSFISPGRTEISGTSIGGISVLPHYSRGHSSPQYPGVQIIL